MNENDKLRAALERIAEAARTAVNGNYEDDGGGSDSHRTAGNVIVCTPKFLPQRLHLDAAETAMKINPVNGPGFGRTADFAMDLANPLAIAVMISKYWGPSPRTLSVSFMETTPAELRRRILGHMNAWTQTECIQFSETTGVGDVRVSREPGGYWSYLGTDILHVPADRQTMNLEGFAMSTDESEYRRVVRHETGHTLGFPHEHMRQQLVARIDPQKAYDFFLSHYGWSKTTVDQQVLTALDDRSIMATPPDQTSIMCYQLPGSITYDRKPIIGGLDINQTDYLFAGKIYPKVAPTTESFADEWETTAVA